MIRDLSMIEHDESNFNRFTKKLNLKIKDVSFIDEPSQPRPLKTSPTNLQLSNAFKPNLTQTSRQEGSYK